MRTKEQTRRREEMSYYRFDRKWTLDKIGILFGVSRERVRQLVGNGKVALLGRLSPHKGRTEQDAILHATETELTNAEVVEKYGFMNDKYRSKTRHATRNPFTKKGYEIEEYVSGELHKCGIKNSLTNSRPVDIVLESGKSVEVKSRWKQDTRQKKGKFYFFPLNRRPELIADFYVLVIIQEGEKFPFVFRREEIPDCMAVGFSWPSSATKYKKYLNRFDVMKG